tara:strand:- start:206 stop:535 length:330 start_codon:yes stop_codon:yes gene_type:complete
MIKKNIIRTKMSSLGFRRDKKFDEFVIHGDYTKNIQIIYIRNKMIKNFNICEFLFFTTDMLGEKIVIGVLVKNNDIKDGVYVNRSVSIPIQAFSDIELDNALNKLDVIK